MLPSGWRKQNFHIRNVGFAVSYVISAFLAILLTSLGLGKLGIIITGLIVILGFILTIIISNRKSKSMVRILRFDYEEIERDFRILFKDNHIQYHRKTEDNAYRYNFLGHGMSMTIQSYTPHDYVFDGPTTEVTLGELSARNESFAERLAELIDEMAEQLEIKRNEV